MLVLRGVIRAHRLVGLALAWVFVVTASIAVAPPALSQSATWNHPIHSDHIRMVYPDSSETSNAPFPPNANTKAVHDQLRTVIVSVHGRRMTLGDYLRSLHMQLSKVVTVKISGDTAAVYTYR